MGEQTSARNAAALRREARKKKILENMTSRLKLIEGIHSSSESLTLVNYEGNSKVKNDYVIEQNSQFETSTDQNVEIKSKKDITNLFETRNRIVDEDEDLNGISHGFWEENNEETKNIFLSSELMPDDKSNNNVFMIAHKKKLHYIFLSIIINILLFSNNGHFFFNNIFCPFWTLKLIEILSGKQEQEEMKVLTFIFVANLPKELQETGKFLLSIFSPIFSDLLLYIFTFIIGTKILEVQFL